MKILYILHGRFPTEKAHGIQIAKLCEAMGKRGHEVTLVALRVGMVPDAFDFYGIQRVFSVRYVSLKPFFRASAWGFMLEKVRFLRNAAALIAEESTDLIITREPLLCFFHPRAPVILEMHDVPRHLKSYVPYMRRAAAVIAKTQGMRNAFADAGIPAERLTVLPNAIDPDEYERMAREDARHTLGMPSVQPSAVYAGSLQEWKGIGTLMRAARLVPQVTFIVVGGTQEDIARLRSESSANVRFVGTVPHNSIPQYLAAADVLLLPNERGTALSERYTSPLKLFEYQAAQRPIIASSLSSIREVLPEDEGYYFEPGDAAGLARAITDALDDPVESSRRAKRSYQRVLGNTWEAYANRLIASVPFSRS